MAFSKNNVSVRVMTRLQARSWTLSRNVFSGMFNLNERPIDAASTLPAANLFAVATAEENTVRVWSHIRKRTAATLPALPCPVTAVALSKGGRWAAAAGVDHQIRVWRVFTEVGEGVEHAHASQIETLAFDPSGDRVFSQDAAGVVKCWPANPAEPLRAMHGELVANPIPLTSSPTITPDGRTCAESGTDGEVRIIDVASGAVRITLPGPRESARLPGNPPAATALAFAPNGRVLVAGYADGSIRRWFASDRPGTGP